MLIVQRGSMLSSRFPFCVSPSGGVMLVHDIRRNESHVIDFRESAPGALREETLQRSWETKVGTLVRRESSGESLFIALLLTQALIC